MDFLKWSAIILIFFFYSLVIFFAIKSKKPLLMLVFNALSGIFAMVIINLTAKYTGCHIPVNYYTVGISSVLGMPGVASLLTIKFLFL